MLGGIFTNVERTVAYGSCPIRDLDKVLAEAQAEERVPHETAMAANPMGKTRVTTPEALKEFTDAEARHKKSEARVRALLALRG